MLTPEKIKALRNEKNLSQEKFAELIGYSKGYLADIETGRSKPSRRFLESIQQIFGASIDWLLFRSPILNLIEYHKKNPIIIFVFAFTPKGIDFREKMLRDLLSYKNYILINASGTKTAHNLLRKILNKEGKINQLWEELEEMLLNNEMILILKNMSLSKIPNSGIYIQNIFDILRYPCKKKEVGDFNFEKKATNSAFIVLDYPSYMEKNMNNFGAYALPTHAMISLHEKDM